MTADRRRDVAVRGLARAGVRVALPSDSGGALYLHAKAIVADHRTAFVGSQNFSSSSLDDNRELGIITADPSVVDRWRRPWRPADAAGATPIGAPAPAVAAPTVGPAAPSGSSPPAPPAGPCPSSPDGRCYRPGEYRAALPGWGQTVRGATGPISCTDDDGWRWEPTS